MLLHGLPGGGLQEADAADAQQRVLRGTLSPGPPGPAAGGRLPKALAGPVGGMQGVVQLGLLALARHLQALGALPPAQRHGRGPEPGVGQLCLHQARGQAAPQAARALDLTGIAESVEPHTGQPVGDVEVIPIPAGYVEEHLDHGLVGHQPGLDDEGAHLPVDGEAVGDLQGAGGLQLLLGQHQPRAEGPQGDVEDGQLLGLEDDEGLGTLQRSAAVAHRAGSHLLEEEGQAGVGQAVAHRQCDGTGGLGGLRARSWPLGVGCEGDGECRLALGTPPPAHLPSPGAGRADPGRSGPALQQGGACASAPRPLHKGSKSLAGFLSCIKNGERPPQHHCAPQPVTPASPNLPSASDRAYGEEGCSGAVQG